MRLISNAASKIVKLVYTDRRSVSCYVWFRSSLHRSDASISIRVLSFFSFSIHTSAAVGACVDVARSRAIDLCFLSSPNSRCFSHRNRAVVRVAGLVVSGYREAYNKLGNNTRRRRWTWPSAVNSRQRPSPVDHTQRPALCIQCDERLGVTASRDPSALSHTLSYSSKPAN